MSEYRKNYKKWLAYLGALAALAAAERAVLCFVPVFGVCPVLIPLAVACVALLEGAEGGSAFGLAAGLLWFWLLPEHGSWYIFLCTLAGFFTGAAADRLFNSSMASALLWSLVCLAVTEGTVFAFRLIVGTLPLSAFAGVLLPETALSVCFAPLVFLMMQAIRRNIGVI